MSISNVSNNTSTTPVQSTGSAVVNNAKTDSQNSEKVTSGGTNNNTSNNSNNNDTAVIYESTKGKEVKKGTYKPDSNLIQKLKADADQRTQQLRDLVSKMLNGQFDANSSMEAIFNRIQNGDITVDEKTAEEAKKSLEEDGYWGVKQTSDRMVSFAKALTGGDPSKIDEMISAFEKGYKQATDMMKKVPDITKQTYDATMEKFEAWRKESQTTQTETK